jgi:hypothetical protein
MIRITVQVEGDHTTVGIAGQMTEIDLNEVQRVRASVSGEVVLSLREMDSCEASGIRFLRAWLEAGAKLRDANPFVELTLKHQANLDEKPIGTAVHATESGRHEGTLK